MWLMVSFLGVLLIGMDAIGEKSKGGDTLGVAKVLDKCIGKDESTWGSGLVIGILLIGVGLFGLTYPHDDFEAYWEGETIRPLPDLRETHKEITK